MRGLIYPPWHIRRVHHRNSHAFGKLHPNCNEPLHLRDFVQPFDDRFFRVNLKFPLFHWNFEEHSCNVPPQVHIAPILHKHGQFLILNPNYQGQHSLPPRNILRNHWVYPKSSSHRPNRCSQRRHFSGRLLLCKNHSLLLQIPLEHEDFLPF